ncbi:hypothetical protein [Altericroceibacterium xinjiangense]|uniref:hypothetical protein n=1 Tax=Altericroceibacterium xinjiangense TaxID=762261 RepID=UPI000F7F79FE|nr:hypothetical protein [Altericroceibacterium xinjiangense]
MAEIPVEKKSNLTWLWVLLGLIILALLIWWAVDDDEEEYIEPVAVEQTLPQPVATAPGVTIGNILGDPASYVGRDDFQAEVTVPTDAEMTDRGFWIEDEGQRLFTIIIDGPMEEPKHINPGQTLRISQGMLRDSTYIPEIPGDPLDADTRNIAQAQPVFLVADESNIEILEAGNPQPGTDHAQTAPTDTM